MHATKASGNPEARIFFASLSASPRPPFPRHQERPNTVVVDGGIEAQLVFFVYFPYRRMCCTHQLIYLLLSGRSAPTTCVSTP